jgi:hypothetical protein
MDRLSFRRVLWVLHRGHLRHGALMWASLAVALAVLALAASVAASALRLQRIGTELATVQAQILHGAPVEAAVAGARTPLPLPSAARRFEITQRILEQLQDKDFAPAEIHFKFEHVAEAGVIRQIAVFTVRTHWDEVAGLLARLQAVDRSIYIARLRVARETADDVTVDADIQLAVALLDDKPDMPVAP